MKKYCFVIPRLSSGGAERAISVFASGIADAGYDVFLIVYNHSKEEYPVSENVKKYYRCDENYSSNRIITFLQKLIFIRRFLKENKVDIVIPFLGNCVIHTFVASRGLRIKFVSTLRNNPYRLSKKERRETDLITLFSDQLFVQNKMQKDYYPKFIQNKTFIVTNPVSDCFIEHEKQYSTTIKKLVAVGRLSAQKNYIMLLKAVKRVAESYPDISLQIFGEGAEELIIKDYIDNNELENNVFLMGRNENIMVALQGADVFVMTSDYEGMPNSLMEAMCFGMPCISTDCPTGPADLISDGENGFLVPVDDEKKLAERILFMVRNPEKANKMGKNARISTCESHSRETLCRQLINFTE